MNHARPLTVLLWHVHGSWTTSFVHGGHDYILPTLPDASPWGRGRAGRDWPDNVREAHPDRLADTDVDVVVLQRPEEIDLAERWLRRRVPADVPAVYVEHNTPHEHAVRTRHVLADRDDVPLIHVTHFNDLAWDSGRAPTAVIPHGIVDPGHLYTGELPRVAALINEPVRRWRVTGTDLLPGFARVAPVDVYGIGATDLRLPGVTGVADLATPDLHRELARHRVYLHTARWTSLGLSLIEAMQLGVPVVALATTEAAVTVPEDVGAVATDVTALHRAVRELLDEPDLAAARGKRAREHALALHGLDPFLRAWDSTLAEVIR